MVLIYIDNQPVTALNLITFDKEYKNMIDNQLFDQFTKKNITTSRIVTNNVVIYTRVSTKEQADNNLSLQTQLKVCDQYAQKMGLNVVGYFGGTFESAKSDERKEFNRMFSEIKKSKVKVSQIIVYCHDRFSRTGPNSIYITSQLDKEGVILKAVTQLIDDPSSPGGKLQQSIYFMFSEYDNQLRRQRIILGMRERLLEGDWVMKPPLGYTRIYEDNKKSVVVNEKGKLLRKAFYWKAKEHLSSEEIIKRLDNLGLKVSNKYMSLIFRNPFYCGLITHGLLDGQIIEGKHEKLVSKELFLEANDVLKSKRQSFNMNPLNEALPLKHFLRCDNCGDYLRGYIVKKKGIHYYKCNNKGCNCNKNAQKLHEVFSTVLSHLVIDEAYVPALEEMLQDTFGQINKDKAEEEEIIVDNLKEVEKKIERLQDRFMDEEIDRALYDKYLLKHLAEKQKIEKQLENEPLKKSNLTKHINKYLEIACNLTTLWSNGNYEMKQRLQFMLFPEGILYNKKKDNCRTLRLNAVFTLIGTFTANCEGEKDREESFFDALPISVVPTRIELVSRV